MEEQRQRQEEDTKKETSATPTVAATPATTEGDTSAVQASSNEDALLMNAMYSLVSKYLYKSNFDIGHPTDLPAAHTCMYVRVCMYGCM